MAACGGGGNDEDPQQVLQQTFSNPTSIQSGTFDLDLRIETSGGEQVGVWQLQGEGWLYHLYRRSLFFSDDEISLPTETSLESLTAFRTGAMALATRPLGKEWRIAMSSWIDFQAVPS